MGSIVRQAKTGDCFLTVNVNDPPGSKGRGDDERILYFSLIFHKKIYNGYGKELCI